MARSPCHGGLCWCFEMFPFNQTSICRGFPASILILLIYASVQFSCVQLFANPWTAACQASLSITKLPELTQTHVHWVIDAIQPSHPLLPPSPSAFSLSQYQGLSNESVFCIRWSKYWSFSFSISPTNEYSGLISFGIDSLDLLAVQGTLKSLLQHHSSKASILQCSAFFIVQLSYPYMTTEKTIALTRWTFVGKVMSLLFNKLSRLVITFLPRSKHHLISWLQSPSAVILELKNIKPVTVSFVSPSICHEVMGPDAMILVFWMLHFKPTFSLFSFTFIYAYEWISERGTQEVYLLSQVNKYKLRRTKSLPELHILFFSIYFY